MKKKILITGGCGYIGTNLVDYLLSKSFSILVIDTQWFGNTLRKKKNLKIIKMNINDIEKINMSKFFAVIHLANIANDPAAELDSRLTWEVNVLFTEKLIRQAIKYKVKKFLYASSGSVYGIKKERKVTEELNLVPLSDYNKSKMIAERVIKSYSTKIKTYCIRPATVCGFSKNMRFDVAVNMFIYQAFIKKKVTVLGGSQIRPNIHIMDLCRVFYFFLKNDFNPGNYNAGFENLKIIDIARKIKKYLIFKLSVKKKTNDPRSYRQDSSKLLKLGFKPNYNVEFAIKELVKKFQNKKIKIKKNFFRVNYMKQKKIINEKL